MVCEVVSRMGATTYLIFSRQPEEKGGGERRGEERRGEGRGEGR